MCIRLFSFFAVFHVTAYDRHLTCVQATCCSRVVSHMAFMAYLISSKWSKSEFLWAKIKRNKTLWLRWMGMLMLAYSRFYRPHKNPQFSPGLFFNWLISWLWNSCFNWLGSLLLRDESKWTERGKRKLKGREGQRVWFTLTSLGHVPHGFPV